MNYIAEINAFYEWLIENPISGNTQALWHRLMAYCNVLGWKEQFTITNGRLVEDLDISRQELDRIRNTLCQKGLISYRKGNGSSCGTYHINSFVSHNVTQSGHKPDTSVAQTGQDTLQGTLPLNKLNETKQNETNNNSSVVSSFENPVTESPESESPESENPTPKKPNSKKEEQRHKYGEYNNVLLSDEDMSKLKAEFPNDWESRIEKLSGYVASTGKTYKSHLATIRNWARNDIERSGQSKKNDAPTEYHSVEEVFGLE